MDLNTINGIGQVTRKPLSGENIQGTFFVLIKTRWDCFCNLQKVLSDSKFFLKVRLQGPVRSVSLWGCVILAESDEIALFNQKRLFLACAYIKITFCSKE